MRNTSSPQFTHFLPLKGLIYFSATPRLLSNVYIEFAQCLFTRLKFVRLYRSLISIIVPQSGLAMGGSALWKVGYWKVLHNKGPSYWYINPLLLRFCNYTVSRCDFLVFAGPTDNNLYIYRHSDFLAYATRSTEHDSPFLSISLKAQTKNLSTWIGLKS